MTKPAFPNIGQLAAQMSANHARVVQTIDQWMTPIDEMVRAAAERDWPKVAGLGHQLSQQSRQAGYRGVSVRAQAVADDAVRPDNVHSTKRSLIRLIGTYGRSARARTTGNLG